MWRTLINAIASGALNTTIAGLSTVEKYELIRVQDLSSDEFIERAISDIEFREFASEFFKSTGSETINFGGEIC